MVKIIFSRTGKKKQPNYRIIALDKKKDPWGNALEILGSYNPRTKELDIKKDRIEYWLSVGAQPSATVHNLLVSQNVISEKKKPVTSITKKRQEKLAEKAKEKEEAAKEEKPAETPAEEAPKEEKPAEAPAEEKKEEKTEEESK